MPTSIVTASRNFLKNAKNARDLMVDLGNLIDQEQELFQRDANKKLVEKLTAKRGDHIMDIIANIAIGGGGDDPEAVAKNETRLREALALDSRGTQLFDAALLAIKNLARDKGLQLSAGILGEELPEDKKPGKPSQDEGNWRESLGYKDRDDKGISDSAKQFDKSFGGASDDDIKRSAAGGKDFKRNAADKNAYERLEDKDNGNQYFSNQAQMAQLLEHMAKFVAAYKQMFEESIGAALANEPVKGKGTSPFRG